MARGAELVVSIITDASKAGAGIDEASGKFSGFQGTMQNLAGPAAAVLAGITAIGVGAISSASDVQQAFGGIDAVFGDSAQQIKDWAADSAEAVGLSTAEYGQFASVVGAQLKNLGVPMDQVAGNTDDLIRLGADLAATYGGTTTDAVNALGSALRGEADPAERYGLALNQTKVNAELAAQGLDGLTGTAATAAKAQVILGLATEQAGGAVGQWGRELDTVASQQQIATAQWENAAAALGEALLPAATAAASAMADFGQWVQQNASWIVPLVGAIAALAAGILVINGAMMAYSAVMAVVKVAQVAATAAQWLWNAALTANPIGLIIAAVAALVAAFIWLWNNNEDFRNFFINLWQGIADFFAQVWEGAQAVVEAVVTWFGEAWANVANFFQQVWAVAVAAVQAYFNVYVTVFTAIFNVIKTVVESVTRFFQEAWNNAVNALIPIILNLQRIFNSVMSGIQAAIDVVAGAFNAVVGAIQNVISWLGRIKIPDIFGAIGGLMGGGGGARSVSAAPSAFSAMAAPAMMSRAAYSGPSVGVMTARAASSSSGTTINLNGGLDSADTIARRIVSLLQQRDRRTGGVTIARAAR